jgi:predicted transcriptional regulator
MKTECFAEGSSLVTVFSDRKRTKILAAFVSERNRDITISYIAQLAGIARSTVYDHLEELEAQGVIEQTREMGNSQYYTLNMDNDLAHELYRLEGIALKNRHD